MHCCVRSLVVVYNEEGHSQPQPTASQTHRVTDPQPHSPTASQLHSTSPHSPTTFVVMLYYYCLVPNLMWEHLRHKITLEHLRHKTYMERKRGRACMCVCAIFMQVAIPVATLAQVICVQVVSSSWYIVQASYLADFGALAL